MSGEKVRLRPMQLEDVDAVWAVDQAAFEQSWSREAFVNELTLNRSAYYLVLEEDGNICGYCGFWLIVDEAHITNIAVHPDQQGKGYGLRLMGAVMLLAHSLGARQMTLEVRVSNEKAQNLYRKLGFVGQGVRRQYYADLEDALIMWLDLSEEALARLADYLPEE